MTSAARVPCERVLRPGSLHLSGVLASSAACTTVVVTDGESHTFGAERAGRVARPRAAATVSKRALRTLHALDPIVRIFQYDLTSPHQLE